MGYYARTGKSNLTSPTKELDLPNIFSGAITQTAFSVDIFFDGKYHEEEIVGALQLLSNQGVEGTVEFYGEDNAQWRFLLQKGKVHLQVGTILYGRRE